MRPGKGFIKMSPNNTFFFIKKVMNPNHACLSFLCYKENKIECFTGRM